MFNLVEKASYLIPLKYSVAHFVSESETSGLIIQSEFLNRSQIDM